MSWYQRQITLPAFQRGFHLITGHVIEGMPEITQIQTGLLHVFVMHTSASLTINENADPDVPRDLESSLNAISVPSSDHNTASTPDARRRHSPWMSSTRRSQMAWLS